MLEKMIEKYLKDELKKIGVDCLKFTSPSHRGVADRLCLARGGRAFFVETKSPDGSLRALQQVFRRRVTSLGFDYYTAYSKDDVDRIVAKEKEVIECGMRQDHIKRL